MNEHRESAPEVFRLYGETMLAVQGVELVLAQLALAVRAKLPKNEERLLRRLDHRTKKAWQAFQRDPASALHTTARSGIDPALSEEILAFVEVRNHLAHRVLREAVDGDGFEEGTIDGLQMAKSAAETLFPKLRATPTPRR